MAAEKGPRVKTYHHHILPVKTALLVGGLLLVLTAVTVWIAGFDFGAWNTPVAMFVASVKAALVCLFFMNLLYDHKENLVIFLSGFLFLAIFAILTASDIFFRGDVYTPKVGSIFTEVQAESRFAEPWLPSPELIGHGKTVYAQQCAMCHGADGKGDGPAGAALQPPPRNFLTDSGWTNERSPTGAFQTITNGIPGTAMAGYSSLSVEDRWALTYYVLEIGPDYPKVNMAKVKELGIGPSAVGGAKKEEKPLPVDFMIERMAN